VAVAKRAELLEALTNLESEDANVFIDPRGNYHMLTNINTCHTAPNS
jgi:hypothetical protein